MILYDNALIIPVDPAHSVIRNGALAVDGDTIADVGTSLALRHKYPNVKIVDMKGDILLPGLINTHLHLAQSLLRGMADELPLFPDWLQGRIWPMQASYTPEEFLVSARLALCEILKTGTTTFVEPMMAAHYGMDNLVNELTRVGIRGVISKIVMDNRIPNSLPAGMTEEREASFRAAIDAFERYEGAANGRVHIWFGPRWTGIFDPTLFSEIAGYMREYGMHTDVHYAEDVNDVAAIREGSGGLTPAEYLVKTGLAGPDLMVIHGPFFPESDYHILAETGTQFSHCPISAMQGSLGYCDVVSLRKTGVNVSLGTDAMACSNNADLFLDMRVAALLQRLHYHDATVIKAWDILEMATICGARAIGEEDRIGSLEKGKKADFIVLDTHQIKFAPDANPVSNVVYSAVGNDVCLTVVDGKVLYDAQNGGLQTLDEEGCIHDANELGKQKYEWLLSLDRMKTL